MNRAVVVSYPRSGFSLLINVVQSLLLPSKDERTSALRRLCDELSANLEVAVLDTVHRHGYTDQLRFNGEFRKLVGGPKWLLEDGRLAVRKYIGLDGLGDFTVNIFLHPIAAEYYDIAHSHQGARRWAKRSVLRGLPLLAAIRDPLDAVVSACFSINALASEYIQSRLPVADQGEIRMELALYKLSDPIFFGALLDPIAAFYRQEWASLARFHTMKWEDLISTPVPTIQAVAAALGLELAREAADKIWLDLRDRNLTGFHKHNFRPGERELHGWRKILTNYHRRMAEQAGIPEISQTLGYGFDALEDTTDIQRELAASLEAGVPIRRYRDEDLFNYAFNKSNIDFARFPFKRYAPCRHTHLERSSCKDDRVALAVAEAMDHAVAGSNLRLAKFDAS